MPQPLIVVYDGACALCARSARFIVRRDPHGRFRFAAAQSQRGREILRGLGLPDEGVGSIVLVEEGRALTRSTGALRIARRLRFPWPALYALILVPRPVRDAVYATIARNRIRWFGGVAACEVPPPELRARLL